MGNKENGSSGLLSGSAKRGGFPRWGYILIGVLIVVGLSVWLLMRTPAPIFEKLPEVTVSLVDTTRMEVFDEYDGTIRASQSNDFLVVSHVF